MSSCNSEACACGTKKTIRKEQTEDNDDVWFSSDDDYNNESNFKPNSDEFYGSTESDPAHIELISLKRKHAKQGYIDGLSKAKEESLQEGFDEGYRIGARMGEIVGELLMKLTILLQQSKVEKQLYDDALSELNIAKVLKSNYFDDKLNIADEHEHPVIRKWSVICEKLNN